MRWETMQWGEISHHKICKCLNDWGEKGLFFCNRGRRTAKHVLFLQSRGLNGGGSSIYLSSLQEDNLIM